MIYKDNKELAKDEFVDIMRDTVGWTARGSKLLYDYLTKSNEDIELNPIKFNETYMEIYIGDIIHDLYYGGYGLEILDLIDEFYSLEDYGICLDLTKSSEYLNFKDALTEYLGGDDDHTRVLLKNILPEVLGLGYKLSSLATTLDLSTFEYLLDTTLFEFVVVEEVVHCEYNVIESGTRMFIALR